MEGRLVWALHRDGRRRARLSLDSSTRTWGVNNVGALEDAQHRSSALRK
jgi:hypothetical protein